MAQYIEADGADVAALEGGSQCPLVDQSAPRDVDEDRTAFHRSERRRVDEVLVRGRGRYAEYDVVGAAHCELEIGARVGAGVARCALGVVVDDDEVHAERTQAIDELATDAAESDDADVFCRTATGQGALL